MIKPVIASYIAILIIASTCAYHYDKESSFGPPVESLVLPESKPLATDSELLPTGIPGDPAPIIPKPEETDLKTDATFWPYFRSYYGYPYYYRYYEYEPRVYYRYYHW